MSGAADGLACNLGVLHLTGRCFRCRCRSSFHLPVLGRFAQEELKTMVAKAFPGPGAAGLVARACRSVGRFLSLSREEMLLVQSFRPVNGVNLLVMALMQPVILRAVGAPSNLVWTDAAVFLTGAALMLWRSLPLSPAAYLLLTAVLPTMYFWDNQRQGYPAACVHIFDSWRLTLSAFLIHTMYTLTESIPFRFAVLTKVACGVVMATVVVTSPECTSRPAAMTTLLASGLMWFLFLPAVRSRELRLLRRLSESQARQGGRHALSTTVH